MDSEKSNADQVISPLVGEMSGRTEGGVTKRAISAFPVSIHLQKNLPVASGVGGGSSDAAAVLRALGRLWAIDIGADRLAAIALGLGADVPVFVRGRSAWAEGLGERLTPLALAGRWYVVVDPGVQVPTAQLFAAPDLTRDSPHLTIPLFVSGAATANVFEPVVRARFVEVGRALDWLNGHAAARLSGSGGCIFAAVGSREAGLAIVRDCPPGMRALVACGVAESRLLAQLSAWRRNRR